MRGGPSPAPLPKLKGVSILDMVSPAVVNFLYVDLAVAVAALALALWAGLKK